MLCRAGLEDARAGIRSGCEGVRHTYYVGRLSERLGRFDDRSQVVQRTSNSDAEWNVDWKRLVTWVVVPASVVSVLFRLAGALGIKDAAVVTVGLGSVVFLVFYVVWRRRRNRMLTGSPTTWPE